MCGLAFPLVIQQIIDGPITDEDMTALWGPAILLVILGLAEGSLFWLRRVLAARPTMQVEATMRADLYDRLQRLPVAWHDRWPAGQLLSRAVSDLSTIRRFLAFGLIFLVVNTVTLVVGIGILIALSWQLGLIFATLAMPLVAICLPPTSPGTRCSPAVRRIRSATWPPPSRNRCWASGSSRPSAAAPTWVAAFLREAGELRATELSKAKVISVLWAAIIALPGDRAGHRPGARASGRSRTAALSAGTLVAFFGSGDGPALADRLDRLAAGDQPTRPRPRPTGSSR